MDELFTFLHRQDPEKYDLIKIAIAHHRFAVTEMNIIDALSQADKGTDEGLLIWIEYMLRGLKVEIEKIDRLLEFDFISSKILIPALKNAHQKKILNDNELKILTRAVQVQEFKTTRLSDIFPRKSSVDKSRAVRRLRERKFLVPIAAGSRTYVPNFLGNELMRDIMKSFDKERFLPLRGEV